MPVETRKFAELPFVVPNIKVVNKNLKKHFDIISNCKTGEEAYKAIRKWENYLSNLSTQIAIITIRYTQYSDNKKYSDAQEVVDELSPIVANYITEYNKVLAVAPYRDYLVSKYGEYYFVKLDNAIKTFNSSIIEEAILENKLVTRYDKIIGTAELMIGDRKVNLSQLSVYLENTDRNTRKIAAQALDKWISDNDQELGEIYGELVKVRNTMAQKLGFANYIELAYLNLGRTSYNAEDVAQYRNNIVKLVVPEVIKLRKKQMQCLGIKKPQFYDFNLTFKNGNPKPFGKEKELVEKAHEMYDDLSKETSEFFRFMLDRDLFDLTARAGKQPGGYSTYLDKYKYPFIFSNFNGTSGDVDVLTHEFGHAFQSYLVRNMKISEYRQPGYEGCEIHSMSMEFFAYPYASKFFLDDASKYRYKHLASALSFLPYGACVDEFQHFVYANPNISHEERCAKWKELEDIYNNDKKYDDCPMLNRGRIWLKQLHIFEVPFYYIDYTIAQVVAFQFLIDDNKSHTKAWNKYLKYCKMGGKYPFVELLNKAKLNNPFDLKMFSKNVKGVKKILNQLRESL